MKNFYIDRIQIEGGFLDGLDVRLMKGLNAIIGARGTGKSTFVELIRFCLGIKGHTSNSTAKSLSHARSVLRDGQITLTLSDGNDSYSFSRTSDSDTAPPIPDKFKLPLIFSQTEVETIGLIPSGRLNIIDNFIEEIDQARNMEVSAISLIEAYSSELLNLSNKVNENEDKTLVLPSYRLKLAALEEEEKKVAAISEQAAQKSKVLNELTIEYINRTKIIDVIKIAYEDNRILLDATRDIIRPLNYNILDEHQENSSILNAQLLKNDAITLINKGIEKIKKANSIFTLELKSQETDQVELTKRGQVIRKEVDQYKEGAGELSRQMQNLKNEMSRIESIQSLNLDIKNRLVEIQHLRNQALDNLDNTREKITQLRQGVCDNLNKFLSPKIRVKLEQLSQLEEYEEVLIYAMKGSGIKYNELAPVICQAIPPRILLNLVEESNIDEFMALISVSKERAFKVLNALKTSVDQIATVRLEDEITFELLDGSEYKGFDELSTGQRCTVILPIILEHQDTVLVVDQPEDHIDNAFIVDTLISSIRRRADSSQIVLTTHNANIPVLGKASEVIHLNSDGTRGYIVNEGKLDSPDIVEAISNVMEGGKQAFKRRADFYG
jgi:ABC-type Mn2+/Zn2+ transport system ATPase subunit